MKKTFSELDEILDSKTIAELEKELHFQLDNGELPGGTIVSEIKHRINQLKALHKNL